MAENERIRITIDGQTREYPKGISYGDIVEEFRGKTDAPVILVTVNGKLRELHRCADRDGTLGLITTKDNVGYNAYKRSACMILCTAVNHVIGDGTADNATIHYALGDSYYYTLKGNRKPDQKLLDEIKQEMHRIVDARLPIMKRTVSADDAVEIFHKCGMYDKEKLFRYRRSSYVNIYSIDGFEDYYYGYMASHTGYVQHFDLQLYDEGFVLMLPNRSKPDEVQPVRPMKKIFQVMKESQEWGDKMDVSTVGELNDRITREGVQSLILIQEALQETKISKIAETICEDANKKFIMVAGPSSSGKTSFSNRLCVQLAAHGRKPHLISVDNYFVNRENTPLDEFGEKNYECIEAIDVEQFNKDALKLLNGERVELPVFNFKTGHREYKGDFLTLGKEDVLVIEGIHGLNDRLSYALPKECKYKIYISALTQLNVDEHNRIPSTDGRLLRRIARDARTRGTSASETIARWPSVRRGEEQNIFVFQESADVMFNSALVYELACLKVYVEPLLFGIPQDAPEYMEAKRLLKFLDYFMPVPSEDIPRNSLLREFVGGSIFNV